jgi:hypothetical protein
MQPQTVILPLRLDATVFSGIAPPPQLLEAMAQARADVKRKPIINTINTKDALDEKLKAEEGQGSVNAVPETPIEGPSYDTPARQGTALPSQPPIYDDAPPSYEDAVASSMPPVDARRPEYAPPPAEEDDVLRRDEKSGLMRRDS